MKEHYSDADIYLKANRGIEYKVCRISYRVNEKGGFSYVFTPNYNVIDLLSPHDFQGIPGLDLDLRKEEYRRDNVLPTFISERVPQENREDYHEILLEYGMEYMEPLEFLIKAGPTYSGDDLYLLPHEEKKKVVLEDILKTSNAYMMLSLAMKHIARGDDVTIGTTEINDLNRKEAHDLLLPFYLKAAKSHKESLEKVQKEKPLKGRGRPRTPVLSLAFKEVDEEVREKRLTIEEASKRLGISVATYHRLRKRFK